MKKTIDNSQKKEVKPLSKRQKVIIIATIIVTVVCLTVGLTLGLTLKSSSVTPEPYFAEFNQSSDYTLTVKWNKIRKAQGYYYQYYYGDPSFNTDDGSKNVSYTENCRVPLERHKGIVAFRVKADIPGSETDYSDWITFNVQAWKLSAPIPTITDSLEVGWTAVDYKYYGNTQNVSSYDWNIAYDGVWFNSVDLSNAGTSIDVSETIKQALSSPDERFKSMFDKLFDYRISEDGVWQDIIITVRVKATTAKTSVLPVPNERESALAAIYDDSEYGIATLTITEELYKNITGLK